MAKGLKTFSLDIGIIKLLMDEPNQSGIINKLLENYFCEKGDKAIVTRVSPEEIEKEIAEARL